MLAATLLAAAAAGCTGTGVAGPSPSDGRSTEPGVASSLSAGPQLSWSQTALPAGVEPRTLTSLGGRLLVGGLAGGTPPGPRMLTIGPPGPPVEVRLTPHTGYAPEARWQSVATDGTRIIAIGGANGGAHANIRWTTWSGTADGVEETPQSFSTFGGWGAGELVDVVVTPGGDAIIGTWAGAQAGLDAAVWLSSEGGWTRQDPAGTALESTKELLVGPRSATASGPGILVAGSAVHLGSGSVTQLAALWRSSAPNAGWHRIDLPDSGKHSEAVSTRCDGIRCTVAGQVDGLLALWDVDGDRATRVAGLPASSIGDSDPLPAPLMVAGHRVQLSTDGGRVAVLTDTTGRWARSAGPDGAPVGAALVGDRLYVVVSTGPGTPTTLWQTDARAWT